MAVAQVTPARFLPLAIFAVIAAAFLYALFYLKPSEVVSGRIGDVLPKFDLAELNDPDIRVTSEDFATGEVRLINFWASWCLPCRAEHPILMEISARNLAPLYGINYKDSVGKAQQFLNELGDAFVATGFDGNGRTGIDFGLSGVPETYLIDGDGTILLQHIGPLRPEDVENKLIPAIEKARAKPKP